MKKRFYTIACLLCAAMLTSPAFAEGEETPVVVIPESVPRDGVEGVFPFVSNLSDWGATDGEPKNWVAISVLDIEHFDDQSTWPLTVEYPSRWQYDAELNAAVAKDDRPAVYVLMLPFIDIPEGKDDLVLSLETMIDGLLPDKAIPLAYCTTEGEDVRYDGNTFFLAMLDALFPMEPREPDMEMVQYIDSDGEFHSIQFNIKGKGSKGLNIVLVFFNIQYLDLENDITYAVRNVELYDPNDDPTSIECAVKDGDVKVYSVNGAIAVENVPESAAISLVNLQTGIQYPVQSVVTGTIAVSGPGIYAVVVNGESFKVVVK